MNEAERSEAEVPAGGARIVRQDFALRSRFNRQRTLTSSWSVLTMLGLVGSDHHLVSTATAIDTELAALAKIPRDQRDDSRLEKIDAAHDAIESEMREFAGDVSKESLHRTLPDLVKNDRARAVDFLDLMLTMEGDGRDHTATRAGTTGFVISLLCMDRHPGSETLDPISLSPRLFYLCEQAAGTADPQVSEIAGALLAERDQLDLATSEERAPDLVHQYRHEIGEHFFVPELLRAFVAYRGTQLMRAFPYHASSSASTASEDAAPSGDVFASPFETKVIPAFAAALQRRIVGEQPRLSAIDRVAWCVDLDFPNDAERKALASPGIGTRENVPGTTILVGLLCRSAEIIADELEPIGISLERLTEDWVRELNNAMKKHSDQLLVEDYKRACALSELRTRYLLTALSDASREQRVREPHKPKPASTNEDDGREFRKKARDLASKAASSPDKAVATTAETQEGSGLGRLWRGFPREMRVKLGVAAVTFALFVGLLAHTLWPSGEMQRIDSAWLASVTPHLVAGSRNGAGTGTAFVGKVDAGWRALPAADQEVVALTIVESLQDDGLANVMIYDDTGVLRIQALGDGSARVVLGN
ncbi:MAG: hypothetical protein QF570_11150 [Myxococcota bacterium]|jgi:hypothetical protein|nr:hypothetical protein [Myxococcota bacterium]